MTSASRVQTLQAAKMIVASHQSRFVESELAKRRSAAEANTADVKWLPNEYPIMAVRLGGIFKKEHLTLTSQSRWVPNRVYALVGKMKGLDSHLFGPVTAPQVSFNLTDSEIKWIVSVGENLKHTTTVNHDQLIGVQKIINELRRKREENTFLTGLIAQLRKELKDAKSELNDAKSELQAVQASPAVQDEGLNTDDPCSGIFSEAEGGFSLDCDASQDEEHAG